MPGDATKAAILAAQKGRDARLAKVASLKSELERRQAELDKVSATVLEAHRALGPLEAKINGERRVRVSGAIEAAIQQAPGRQALCRCARQVRRLAQAPGGCRGRASYSRNLAVFEPWKCRGASSAIAHVRRHAGHRADS